MSTRERLLTATVEALRADGIAGVSARAIAARAGVNQALVFYHFGSVTDLLRAATRASVEESVASYRERFDRVESLTELLALGRDLHEREREAGNVALMAQVMAGGQQDAALAEVAAYAMATWRAEIESVVARVVERGPLGELVGADGLASAIGAAFIGLELLDGVDAPAARSALAELERLGELLAVLDDLGPVASRAVVAATRRRRSLG
mgnify:CR=1 FL=1